MRDETWTYNVSQKQRKTVRIRAEQTVYAIGRLRQEYEGYKIFVWGHSEGAGVANLVDEQVDGIITTGHQCGRGASGSTEIRKDVPLLAIMGPNDRYIKWNLGFTTHGNLQELCAATFHPPKWNYLIVERMGHAAPLSNSEVKTAVDQFFGTSGKP